MADTSNLIKWIDLSELQQVQESFVEMSGMSVVTADTLGNALTRNSNESSFCDYAASCSKTACELCNMCKCYAASESKQNVRGTFSYCHMGLVEFSAPIIVDDQTAAIISGGMVFERPPVKSEIYLTADRYGLDRETLWETARKVPICSISQIEKSAHFLYGLAGMISGNANGRIQMARATREIEIAGQMKTDFLANMSHEIRTPMNAVIGLADIALQEEMSDTVRESIEQIQSSGKNLLHIINDILDYSKIASGKMSIIEEEYDPAIIIRDVNTIISNRLHDQKEEVLLFIDVDPRLPRRLYGDSARIQQLLINLANNAVKFTNKGKITVTIGFKKDTADSITLKVSVADTGIGIRPEDLNKLFKSFSQVDSKRNRNVEGTGLGLAIVKQLVELMHGTVSVESEYEKGSCFSFEIPQKIIDASPIIKLRDSSRYVCIGFFENPLHARHFQTIADSLGVPSTMMDNIQMEGSPLAFDKWADEFSGKEKFVYVEQALVEKGIMEKYKMDSPKYDHTHFIILLDPYVNETKFDSIKYAIKIKRPLNILNLVNVIPKDSLESFGDSLDDSLGDSLSNSPMINRSGADVNFKAPTAKVLVVDDTPMNLKVADRFLRTMGITADCVSSGQEALNKIEKITYDLIFMDHMMPGLDGVDTTRIIRRFHPKLNSIPIIALTANAMEDARKMFLDEGMNDFIAKPIEIKVFKAKVLQWLPPSKIELVEN